MSIAVRVESFRELNSFSRSSRTRVCVRVCLLVVFLFTSTSLSLCLSLSFYQISRNTRKNRVGGERIVVENCLRSSLISRSSNTRVLFMSLDLLLDILNEIFSL